MKITKYPLLVLSGLVALLTTTAHGQSVTIKRTGHYRQTGASTITQPVDPFIFEIHLRGGAINMTNWGPAFYKPGSGGTPASGASEDTNTGTLNFSSAPNNGTDYAFMHLFASDAALKAFYPTAPTDGGQYGLKFLGTSAPTPAEFTAGLVFASGNYPTPTPQIASVNNGATWAGRRLVLSPTGVTTLTFNAFPEYATATHGALVSAGIWQTSNGDIIDASSVGGYRAPSLGVNQAAPTSIQIDGANLIPGALYTLEIQYGILGGAPASAMLNSNSFVGSGGYYKVTRIIVQVDPPETDFNGDEKSDIVWQNTSTGVFEVWTMDNYASTGTVNLTTLPTEWRLAATADFSGDGHPDLLWENTSTGVRGVWIMDGYASAGWVSITTMPTEWRIATATDFSGDHHPDLVWENTSTGLRGVWIMNGYTSAGWVAIGTRPTEWRIAN